MSENSKQIKTIINHLRDNIPDLIAVYAFGSWGTKYERPDSDIDIAILTSHYLNVLNRVDIAQKLAQNLGKDVDLVDLKGSPTVMQAEIVVKGSRVYCDDSNSCERFEDFVFSSYARLNEERAGILEDIGRRGSVYG